MKQIFEQAIASVNSAYPSIYTKEDVVRLIQDIQAGVETVEEEREIAASVESSVPPVNQMVLESIKERLLVHVKNIDFEDFVSLDLGYGNQIEISIDERGIAGEVEVAFEAATADVAEAPQE